MVSEAEKTEKKKKKIENIEESSSSSSSSWPDRPTYPQNEDGVKAWGILLFGLIGATVTTFAVGQLRRTANWFSTQKNNIAGWLIPGWDKALAMMTMLSRTQSSWKDATSGSLRSGFKEEAWKRYNRRMQEEYEEEMERVERIRRMQSVFNRERNKYKRSYESWKENDRGSYHQHFQREDWYWKTDTSYKDQRANSRAAPRDTGNFSLSHHYSVLGLDRSRTKPYTDAEIKTAFREKAKEYHPDQNQDNKEVAEAKFKEVMTSYEAIKLEKKNEKL